jgi:hypothetical protein
MGLGISPERRMGFLRFSGSGTGMAERRASV